MSRTLAARILSLMCLAVLVVAGCDDGSGSGAGEGEEQGPCFPNGTCNPGLVCASNICVTPEGDTSSDDMAGTDTNTPADTSGGQDTGTPEDTSTPQDTGTADTSVADTGSGDTGTADTAVADTGGGDTGGMDTADMVDQLPVAEINHPSDGETRQLSNGAFPFSGTATDPQDGPLSGMALVWTSSLDGQIGTGESFSAALTTAGEHDITLTATDSDGNTGTDTITITME